MHWNRDWVKVSTSAANCDENDKKKALNEFIDINAKNNSSFKISNLKRKRRAISKLKTIETAIFVDKHLLNKYSGMRSELIRQILAIMNEVQLIYNFKSMKTRIKIVIVKLVFLSQPDSGPDTANGDIDQYLDNFCNWQTKKWRQQNSSHRWDHALMLTGLDLYKQNGDTKNKKVLGLAWVNGMCKPTYSCTLNEGKSFEAAFVIAHEMGHSLGILHDGTGNNCDGDKFIMSEKTGPGKINWSPCSNIYLDNFLTKANAKCLDDESYPPSADLNFERSNRLPGEQYPPNKQCLLALGSQYKTYTSSKEPFNDICRELWCLSGSWATPAHPALEGSTCGDSKKCTQGVCQSSSAYVSHRSDHTLSHNSNRVMRYESTEDSSNTLLSNQSNDTTMRSKSLSRTLMDSIKGFLRSATTGAQDFFKLFTG
ncbi:A disintegrin and metalloproteinase with thrombospondin motifs adt-2-like [Oppia nitens]|uniref:A disintegrin and metalloproteinase with thrombospondin motifs adt-2-like n=1 Tax=Oppia nitens TaxID=1686743 RepID=UPI0023DB6DE0|nr:A disintegrin and metalloproteinase with thrombospondin motifs adt-2-like [Oppia nitens]